MRGRRSRRFGVLALGVMMVVSVGACGDDDDDGATPTTGAGATTTADDGGEGTEPRTVVVGHAYPDLADFAEINPAFGIGDPEEQALAVVEHWRSEGLLPEGVEIELVQRAFDSTDTDDQLAVCQAFAEEDGVDFLVAGFIGTIVAECTASRYGIPSLLSDSAPTAMYETAGPHFFTLRADENRVARSFIAWADDEGLLEGRTIGVYYDVRSSETFDAARDELESRGYTVASEVESTGVGIGSEQDQVAVQRHQADGVDLVIPMVGTTQLGNFQQFADDQGYTPEYIDFEYSGHLNDTGSLALSVDQYDGTRAVSSSRIGDLTGGLSEATQDCVDIWEAFSGLTYPTAAPETGEATNVPITCDLLTVFLEALHNAVDAGSELDADAFVAGIEEVRDLELARWELVSFGPDDHSGAETQREVVFDGACQCFQATGGFEEYPI